MIPGKMEPKRPPQQSVSLTHEPPSPMQHRGVGDHLHVEPLQHEPGVSKHVNDGPAQSLHVPNSQFSVPVHAPWPVDELVSQHI